MVLLSGSEQVVTMLNPKALQDCTKSLHKKGERGGEENGRTKTTTTKTVIFYPTNKTKTKTKTKKNELTSKLAFAGTVRPLHMAQYWFL